MLHRYLPTVTFQVRNLVVQNVVAHVVVPMQPGQKLNIQRLYEDHSCNCTFQQRLFPGLILRPDRSPVVLLIFSSGKIVITGAALNHNAKPRTLDHNPQTRAGGRREIDIAVGWERLWPLVREYVE
jgi:TATA-box binding protein (TBP) (component of TFIID and TFIIIB)